MQQKSSGHDQTVKPASMKVTGSKSGLGKFLVTLDGFEPFQVDKTEKPSIYAGIVHAGYRAPNPSDIEGALSDSLEQIRSTSRLLKLFSANFVYISSIDVFPKCTDEVFDEGTSIDLRSVTGHHGLLKLYLESLVEKSADRFAIVRPGLMVGSNARPNVLSRVIAGDPGPYTLSPKSTFLPTPHHLVGKSIQAFLQGESSGRWAVVPSGPVTLEEVAIMSGNRGAQFGQHLYLSPTIEVGRLEELLGEKTPSGQEVIEMLLSNK